MANAAPTGSGQKPWGCRAAALEVQVPSVLADAMQGYLAQRPGQDVSGLLRDALAQFLVQQGDARAEVRELYLDGLFSSSR